MSETRAVILTLTCDSFQEDCPVNVTKFIGDTIKEARHLARRSGWSRRNFGWVCYHCARAEPTREKR